MKNMKKTFLWLMLAASAILLHSCKEGLDEPHLNKDEVVRLNYNFNQPATRANVAGTHNENMITEIGIIFYNTDGIYVAHIVKSVLTQGQIEFYAPTELIKGTRYNLLVLANGASKMLNSDGLGMYISTHSTRSYQMMKDLAEMSNLERMKPNLPFFGESFFTFNGNGLAELAVTLTRSVAKIRVYDYTDKLKIDWIKIGNFRTGGCVFDQGGNVGDIERGTSGDNGAVRTEVITNPNDPLTTIDAIESGLYTFPNMISASVQNDKYTTCLVIAAWYNEDGWGLNETPEGDPTFYRVNVSRDGGGVQILKPNNLYTVNIKNAGGHGDINEDDALDNPVNKLNVEINDWVQDDEGGNIVIDDEGNYLQVSPSYLTFHPVKDVVKSISIAVKEGTEWSYIVGAATSSYFNVIRDPDDIDNKLIVTTKADGLPTSARKGTIEITVKKKDGTKILEKTVDLVQMANSGAVDVLIVDGQSENFSILAISAGDLLRLNVSTGSPGKGWVTATEGVEKWCFPDARGGDGAILKIDIHPFIDIVEKNRESKIFVHFDGNNNGVADKLEDGADLNQVPKSIEITLTQHSITTSISLFPAYSSIPGKEFEVQSFMPGTILNPRGAHYNDFTVYSNYPWYKVTLSYEKEYSTLNSSTGTSGSLTSMLLPKSSQFRVFTYYSLPGEKYEKGNITIQSYTRNNDESIVEGEIYSFPYNILNNCEYAQAKGLDPITTDGHVYLNMKDEYGIDSARLYIYDRNAGAPKISPEAPLGLMHLWGGDNEAFRGSLLEFSQAEANEPTVTGSIQVNVCEEGWRLPNFQELSLIYSNTKHIYRGGNYYWIKSDGLNDDGDYYGTYFPHNTTSGTGNKFKFARIWGSEGGVGYLMYFYDDNSSISQYSAGVAGVRCVQGVPIEGYVSTTPPAETTP